MKDNDILLTLARVAGGGSGGGGGGDYVASDWLDVTKPTGVIVSDVVLATSSGSPTHQLAFRKNITAIRLTESLGAPNYLCHDCFELKTFVMCKGGSLTSASLYYCTKLEALDVKSTGGFNTDCVRGDNKLKTIVIRGDTIKTFGLNAFRGWTPPSGCTFYINKSLYDHLGDGTDSDYKAATNWSSWSYINTVNWASIEGSIYETQYVDGTPIPTT